MQSILRTESPERLAVGEEDVLQPLRSGQRTGFDERMELPHLLQKPPPRDEDEEIEGCLCCSIVSQNTRVEEISTIETDEGVRDAERRDEAESDDAEADEDVFRERLANHLRHAGCSRC